MTEALPSPPATPARCPACLKPLKPEARFCTACGRDLARPRPGTGQRPPVGKGVEAEWLKIRGLLLGIVAILVISFGVAGLWEPEWQALLLADGVMAALVIAWSLMRVREVAPVVSRLGISPAWLPLIAAGGAATWALATLLLRPIEMLWPEGVAREEVRELFPNVAVAVVSVCLVPAIFEELMFRGIIQGRLAGLVGRNGALLATAAIFAIAHLNPLGFWGFLFPMGLYFGWLRVKTGSVYPGMVAHFAHNAAVLIAEYLQSG